MASATLHLVFVMDPPQSVDPEADTTFALMEEAQRRGHEILYLDPAHLAVDDGALRALVRPLTLRRERAPHVKLGSLRSIALDDEADVVFQRKDPPVDAAYVETTQLLTLCRRAVVLNRPAAILSSNEKLYALHFPELMPETAVLPSIPQILEFIEKMGGDAIVKPLDGRGGEGIFHLRLGDANLNSILEQSTRFGTRRVMVQRYLPQVREGDKRILLLEGEPLGALLRVPSGADVRANLHVGGRAAAAALDDRDREIVGALAPRLRADGLFFVGIDVIGGLLTEVNVTSPTGIQEMSRLDGEAYVARVVDRVEGLTRNSRR